MIAARPVEEFASEGRSKQPAWRTGGEQHAKNRTSVSRPEIINRKRWLQRRAGRIRQAKDRGKRRETKNTEGALPDHHCQREQNEGESQQQAGIKSIGVA